MNTKRTVAPVIALVLAGTLSLTACSGTSPTATATPGTPPDSSTIQLVNAAAGGDPGASTDHGPHRPWLRARLTHVLHATWVTRSASGPVTHQAIRGKVTAVSESQIRVEAADGVSMTFQVTDETKVRARSHGHGADSTIDAVTVGSRALVTGVGETQPTARLVVFRTDPPSDHPADAPTPAPTDSLAG